MRPSILLQRYTQGRVCLDDLPPAIQSWARLPIYQRACDVLAAGDKEARGKALEQVPESMRGDVEVEAMRLWRVRREGNR